jgi:hypothetical protein
MQVALNRVPPFSNGGSVSHDVTQADFLNPEQPGATKAEPDVVLPIDPRLDPKPAVLERMGGGFGQKFHAREPLSTATKCRDGAVLLGSTLVVASGLTGAGITLYGIAENDSEYIETGLYTMIPAFAAMVAVCVKKVWENC